MPETFDNVVITDRLTVKDPNNESHIIIESDGGRIYRNGVDIIGGESPIINRPTSNDPTALQYLLDEVVVLLHRGGFGRPTPE